MLVLLLGELLLGHGQGVVHPEVVDDDGHGHGDGQHPRQGAQGAHQHARPRDGVHVPVAQGGHGDHRPPEPDGDVLEVSVGAGGGVPRVGADPLGVVDHGGEDEDPQRQEDDEEEELVGAGPQGVAQDPEAHEVAGELEDPEDSDEADHPQEAQHVLGGLGGQAAQPHLQVEGQDGHEVDDVEGALEELGLVRAEDDPEQDLDGEPDDAHALHVGQPAVGDHLEDHLLPRAVVHRHELRLVVDGVEGLVRLQAKRGDGDEDEEEGAERHVLEGEKEGGTTVYDMKTLEISRQLCQNHTLLYHQGVCMRLEGLPS
ncbi:hypothetical protein ANANG_G00289780 [Anguilla anguilla]|uniref:Uncharacterized protein n=1 Tax=Anguilla anguilla TaxID=7936 RepID=A0A9D3LTA5_ANGAN|nr:hypothetical protein ANANG_G00289780 [Anguilla anguilla]